MTSAAGLVDRIEALHNKASDTDFVWFPFLFLKLKPEQSLTLRRRAVMTLRFAPYFVAFLELRRFLFGRPVDGARIVSDLAVWLVVFFGWFNLVTATFWNRRARRLAREGRPLP
jgi:hypothetical protein